MQPLPVAFWVLPATDFARPLGPLSDKLAEQGIFWRDLDSHSLPRVYETRDYSGPFTFRYRSISAMRFAA